MHTIQAMTSVHDRYLSNSSPRQTPAESYHLSQAAALFNKKLSEAINPHDKDALWATAVSKYTSHFCLKPSRIPFLPTTCVPNHTLNSSGRYNSFAHRSFNPGRSLAISFTRQIKPGLDSHERDEKGCMESSKPDESRKRIS